MSDGGQHIVHIAGPLPPDLLLQPMRWFVPIVAIVTLISAGFLAAAVVRRLHDSGRRGGWGLLPLPFLLAGLIAMIAIFSQWDMQRAPGIVPIALMFGNNLAYLAALAMLVVQLCRPGNPDTNQFGPPLA